MKAGLTKYNDGFRYIFVCTDVFSRKAYGQAMKSKDTESCLDALQYIIDKKAKARPKRHDGRSRRSLPRQRVAKGDE